MTKTAQKTEVCAIRRKREQIAVLRGELEDLTDPLDVLEARAVDNGKPHLAHADVKRRYGLR